MPEYKDKKAEKFEILTLQNNLIELKKKLLVERQMFEAAKLIKVRMDKQSNVRQVENSLEESMDRIAFLEGQVREIEEKIFENEMLKRNESESKSVSGESDYVDAVESSEVSSLRSTSPINSQQQQQQQPALQEQQKINLNWLLAGQKLTWPKIDYKITELSYRLKINENILEAEEKLIEAFKTGTTAQQSSQSKSDLLLEEREVTKQRVQVLNQALKKYTSLVTIEHAASTPATPITSFDDSLSEESGQFTGKLLIKITKIAGLNGTSPPPFTLNFDLDHLAKFRSGSQKSKVNRIVLSNCSKDPENPSAYTCYQEIAINLVRSRELELSINSSNSAAIKGMFFVKLATLFASGPNEEGSIVNTFEIEPAGSISLQFHYTPNKMKKDQITKERVARIQRRPAIKRTQHLIKGHELISTNFFQLLKCSYCQEMIMNTSGYQCKLCKLICHKKCYSKIFETCLYSEKQAGSKKQDGEEEVQDPLIEQFTSKYNIPHRQKLVSVAIPSWCAHCGHFLPLGRKINYKCEECSIVWHDRCDPHVCKTHCGLNANILETYLATMQKVQVTQQMNRSVSNSIKSEVKVPTVINAETAEQAEGFKKNLTIEDFELIRCIGKGNFGKVMLAKYKESAGNDSSSGYYAIKMLKKHSVVENEEYQSLRTEKKILQMATSENHPFLVHLKATFQDDFRLYFVLEYVNGGDLMFHIQSRLFSLADCKFYAAQVLLALEYLHSRGVLYRDLKLDNILLSRSGNIKLADYGLSKCEMSAESRTRTFCGTPEFMAPEILLDLPYGLAVDYWAFGVLLYQLLESRSPFYGSNEKETFQSILRGKIVFNPETDKNGKALISKLLQSKPSDRIGIKNGEGWKAIKDHDFFSEIDWSALSNLNSPVPFLPKVANNEDVSNFDEIFTNEDVLLTPYPSFVFSRGGNTVARAVSIFAEF